MVQVMSIAGSVLPGEAEVRAADGRGSADLETWLRRFRAGELASRQRPTSRRLYADAAARTVPFLAGYAGMLMLADPWDVLAAVVFSVATISLLGSWFHDGVHGSIRHPLAAPLKRLAAAPVAFSAEWWMLKHIRLHHRYPGNPLFDPDIQFGRLVRVTRGQPWSRRHATQHWHMWLLYPFATLNMLKPNEPALARRFARLIQLENVTPGWRLFAGKYVPWAAVWVPVFVVRPALVALLLFVVFNLVAGVMTALITQVQHNTALSDGDVGDPGRFFLTGQLMRTADVGQARGVWWWLSGGASFHVAHHLAPTLSFLELPEVTRRLRAGLGAAGGTLHTHAGLWAAVRSHARLLRDLSRPDGDARKEST